MESWGLGRCRMGRASCELRSALARRMAVEDAIGQDDVCEKVGDEGDGALTASMRCEVTS